MRRWTIVAVALMLGALCLGAAARTQDKDWGGDFGPRHGRRMGARGMAMLESDRFKTALGLTDDQSARLRQILVEAQKSTVKTRADIGVRRIELRELLRADQPDREAVMKKVAEISALRGQIMQRHVESRLGEKAVLTPEQQKKFRTLMAHRFGKQSRRGGSGGRRFGPRPEAGAPPPLPPPPAQPPVE